MKSKYLGFAALVFIVLFFIYNSKLIEGLTSNASVQWGTAHPPRPYTAPTKFTSCDQINNQLNLTEDERSKLCTSTVIIDAKTPCNWIYSENHKPTQHYCSSTSS